MPRGKNCCEINCCAIALTTGSILKDEKMSSLVGQKLPRDSRESIFAARHQDVSQGPLGWFLWHCEVRHAPKSQSMIRAAQHFKNPQNSQDLQPFQDCHAQKSQNSQHIQVCHAPKPQSIQHLEVCHAQEFPNLQHFQVCHAPESKTLQQNAGESKGGLVTHYHRKPQMK